MEAVRMSLDEDSIWATAFIYFDEKKMWRLAGFEQMLVSPAKRDHNEMGGLQKEIGFDVHHVYEQNETWWKSAKTWETRLKRGGGTP